MPSDRAIADVHLQVLPAELFKRCLVVARMTNAQLAAVLGISTRTMSRWLNGGLALMVPHQYADLARAMFPHDRAFAGDIARIGGTSLEALGLGVPPPPPAVPAPPAPATPAPPSSLQLAAQADAVLCYVAERLDVLPRQARPILAAAFARAHALGLTTELLAKAFAEAEAAGKGS